MNQYLGPYSSYRLKILVPPILVLLFLLSSLSVVGKIWLRDVAQRLAQSHADATSVELSYNPNLDAALKQAGDKGLQPLLDMTVDRDPQLLFAVVRVREQTTVGTRGGQDGNQLREQLLERQLSQALTQGVVQSIGGTEFVATRRQLLPVAGRPEAGELWVGVSLQTYGAELRGVLFRVLGLLGGALLIYGIVAVYLLDTVGRRMQKLAEAAQRIESGDLKARIGDLMPEELGLVGRAFDGAADRLSHVVGQIDSAARTAERTASDVGEAKTTLQRGLNTQVRDVDDALSSVRDIMQALSMVVKEAESTRDEMRGSVALTQRLSNTVHEETTTVEEAERVITLASESIQQVALSTSDIAKHADTLSDNTASTANAMLEMKHSIARVRETAITAASIAEQAGLDAERGTMMLTESMTGIEHIREASRAVGQVTEDLEKRVGEIGDVLHLITELTQRTNLLALNASIIAAQAGSEGRGFAVVADEIKDLARRTAHSAGSIDTLIQAVAEGAHAARRAAVAGADAVENGATQANEAAKAMTDILSRLKTSAAKAKLIADDTDDQARKSAYVTRSVQEVQGHVNDISSKAVEQTRRTEYLQRQVGRMRELIDTLSRGSREQRDGMTQIVDTVARVVRSLEDMSTSQRSRLAEGERVRGMLEVLRRVVTTHRDQIATFDRAVSDLHTQAIHLRDELSRIV